MNEKLQFLTSRRFWGLVVIAIVNVFAAEGILPVEIVQSLVIIVVCFIGIRTIDKFTENNK